MTINSYIKSIREKLSDVYPSSESDALISIIFKKIYNYSAHGIIMHASDVVNSENETTIDKIIERLLHHEPIQYILNEAEFYGLYFDVTPDVLIPRNETEELVNHIIYENSGFDGNILDIGTGSGCIAVSLKKYLPKAQVFACDISLDALSIAKRNALKNSVDVTFFQLDVLSGKKHNVKYDMIVSNPPYVTENEKRYIEENVLNHEPQTALFVPNSKPLMFYEAILNFASENLNANGYLWFEINEAFGNEMIDLLKKYKFAGEILKDINNKDRMVWAKK
ncbi:MAG: peptide chain release factor N(5)-glutamine methyltransferase [Prolixibacteraceae bacterium]|jgi:release factor glutamine methyltransferase|nr:peptide chain release factor N(5)-glutamine methyltransferase [Prolixibacteraceae bacterium]